MNYLILALIISLILAKKITLSVLNVVHFTPRAFPKIVDPARRRGRWWGDPARRQGRCWGGGI